MEKNAKHLDGNVLENAFPNADAVIENVKEKGDAYWTKAKSKWFSTKSFIQKHPIQAMGYAALLGAAVGVIFYPKKRSSK